MTIITPTTETPTHQPIDDRSIMHTPRPRMLEILQRALLRRESVQLGNTQFRFCKQGDTFDDGDTSYETLYTGLYQRFGVWLHTTPMDGPPHHYTWMHVGDLGWCEEILNPILDQLSAFERESAIMNITFRHVMKEMRQGRTTPRTDSP